jgi:hypothetical protein
MITLIGKELIKGPYVGQKILPSMIYDRANKRIEECAKIDPAKTTYNTRVSNANKNLIVLSSLCL